MKFNSHILSEIKKVLSIELDISSNDSFSGKFLVLEKKGNAVHVKKEGTFESWDSFPGSEFKGLSTTLTLTGKGILSKEVPTLASLTSTDEKIHQIIPNGRSTDFYLQEAAESNTLSLIRKDSAQALISKLEAFDLDVFSLSLAGLPGIHVHKLLSTKTNQFGKHHFEQDNNIVKYHLNGSENSNPVLIGEQSINSSSAVAFGAGLQALASVPQILVSDPGLTTKKEELLEKKKFKLLGTIFLGFFLTALLVNYFLFSGLIKENQTLQNQVQLNASLVTEKNTLQSKINEKEGFFTSSGWIEQSKISLYADKIAASVPKEIKLTALTFNPIDREASKKQRETVLQKRLISIHGKVGKTGHFNDWSKLLASFDFVKEVVTVHVTYNERERTNEFELNLYLN